jgi:hypothetical protein
MPEKLSQSSIALFAQPVQLLTVSMIFSERYQNAVIANAQF